MTTLNPELFPLTTEEVCSALGICRKTLFNRTRARGWTAIRKIGRRNFYPHDVLTSSLRHSG